MLHHHFFDLLFKRVLRHDVCKNGPRERGSSAVNQKSRRNNPEKFRLDQILVDRGLAESREKARRMILAGQVRSQTGILDKPGKVLPADAHVEILQPEKYVGRGGLKLEAALVHFALAVTDRVCLDIGSSTGGFTDCLLQAGAARVYAFDVGSNQMVWSLRQHPKVILQEGFNARNLSGNDVPERVSLLVADVSFISLELVLPPAFELLLPGGDCVALVKPQFELSKSEVSRGGVVREEALRQKALAKIRDFSHSRGWTWVGEMNSPITGAKGNLEFLVHIKK
jgi:23S rRNA (cytidine1920-2'-O)/16S rRNA (cytidine1409-2'-O)-methyltransferase